MPPCLLRGRAFPPPGFACRVDVKPFPDDPRRPAAVLDRLDPPQDQLGIRLADGEGSHGIDIDKIRKESVESWVPDDGWRI